MQIQEGPRLLAHPEEILEQEVVAVDGSLAVTETSLVRLRRRTATQSQQITRLHRLVGAPGSGLALQWEA